MVQTYLAPHRGFVAPFALVSGSQFRPPAPEIYPTHAHAFIKQAEQILQYSANLTDRETMIAESWADGPSTETAPGHWALFAQFVSRRDHHTVDDDVVMFFAVANALHDAGIAVWEAKRYYDYVRPITAVHFFFATSLGSLEKARFRGLDSSWDRIGSHIRLPRS